MSTWSIGNWCVVYVEKDNKWYNDGRVIGIDHDHGQWISVAYGSNGDNCYINTLSNHIIQCNNTNYRLKPGSYCSIFSIYKWCQGMITKIENDKSGEWLTVKYHDEDNKLQTCKIRRHSDFIKYKDYNKIPSDCILLRGINKNTNYYHPWIKLHDLPPNTNHGDFAQLTSTQFILTTLWQDDEASVSDTYSRSSQTETESDGSYSKTHTNIHGVYKFDMIKLEWELFLVLHPLILNEIMCSDSAVRCIYSSKMDRLYLCYPDKNDDYCLCIVSNILGDGNVQYQWYPDCIENKLKLCRVPSAPFDFEVGSNTIFIETKHYIHLMGGYEGDEHLRIDKDYNTIKVVHC